MLEKTLKTCDSLIKVDPDDVSPYRDRAFILLQLCRNREALKAIEQALTMDPYCSRSYYVKGLILEKLQHPEEALHAYKKATKLDPSDRNVIEARNTIQTKLDQKIL